MIREQKFRFVSTFQRQTWNVLHFLQGPANPFKTKQQLAIKNTLSGYAEEAHVSDFNFENQRRTFHSYGKSLPGVPAQFLHISMK